MYNADFKIHRYKHLNKGFEARSEARKKALLRHLSEQLGREVDKSELSFQKNKKPCFKLGQELFFNLSNSDKLFMTAVSEIEIGVDIELKRDIQYKKLITHICHPKDKIQIESLNNFFKVWIAKESYLKLIGTGLEVPMSEIFIEKESNAWIMLSNIYPKAYLSFFETNQVHICLAAFEKFGRIISNQDHRIQVISNCNNF